VSICITVLRILCKIICYSPHSTFAEVYIKTFQTVVYCLRFSCTCSVKQILLFRFSTFIIKKFLFFSLKEFPYSSILNSLNFFNSGLFECFFEFFFYDVPFLAKLLDIIHNKPILIIEKLENSFPMAWKSIFA
jgi:hypothetical protein